MPDWPHTSPPPVAAPARPMPRYDADLPSPWRGVLLALLAVGLAVAAYFYFAPARDVPPPAPVAASAPPPAPAPAPEPTIQFPIEQAVQTPAPKAAAPLTLEGSDAAAQAALSELVGTKALALLFRVDNVVRRIVATVDALPREKASQALMPIKPAGGQFIVTRTPEALSIAPENAVRYDSLIQLFQRVDAKALVSAYVRNYALFQQAYRELGYPKGYFNDRLVAAIDSLLATPDVPGPIALTQPKVFYEFARPELEALPAGQKAMLRMGADNARLTKAKLREVRALLVGQAGKQ
jgi:Protein of unknown function (DUF3014)